MASPWRNKAYHWLHGLDYAQVLPLLARLPLPLGYLLASWRGWLNGRARRDWRSMALGTRHIARQSVAGFRLLLPDATEARIARLVRQRYAVESREEFEGRLIAADRVGELSCALPPAWLDDCRQGGGLVLLTPHFDSFMLGIAFIARAGLRVNVMTSSVTHHPAVAAAVSAHFAAKYRGMEKHCLNGGLMLDREPGMRPFYKMLERGEVLVILADAPATEGGAAVTPHFLGARRELAGGALRLAQKTDSRIGAFVCRHLGGSRYRLEASPLLDARHPQSLDSAFELLSRAIQTDPGRWWAADMLPALPVAPGKTLVETEVTGLPAGWQVRAITPADSEAMRELFATVFGTPMTAAHWAWKYENGHGAGIGVWDGDGRLLAHYGGAAREVLVQGESCMAVQGADACVLPQARGRLTRKGAYYHAATTFHRCYIGAQAPYRYGFGFPSRRHYELAARLGLYREIDQISNFSFAPAHGRHGGLDWQDAGAQPMAVALADPLWSAALTRAGEMMGVDLQANVVGVRSLAHLAYRYAENPLHDYQLLALRCWPELTPQAFAVVRQDAPGRLLWLDVIAPLALLPALARRVQRYAHRHGITEVHGWITASQQHHFAAAGAQLSPTEVVVPANIWAGHADFSAQIGRWWLMAGDTDFL